MTRFFFLDGRDEDWSEYLLEKKAPRFVSKQIHQWIYERFTTDPECMTNLAKSLRQSLAQEIDWQLPKVHSRIDSPDGTTKLLLKNAKGRLMETVVMRYEGRTSVCVSSQVGCKLACDFCQTGKMGFMAHLSRGEILAQLFRAAELLAEGQESRRITHVVFMGMGEPFDNYDAVISAANAMIQHMGLSAKNVTLSTSGIAPRIAQLAADSPAALALSLHSACDELRTQLMPINRKYPLATLKESLLSYQKASGKKITLEYILIKGLTDTPRAQKALVKFIHGLRVKVNLIPFNPHPGMPYEKA